MEKILVSACLMGENTRYDGSNNQLPELEGLLEFYELVLFCPEVEGGLPTPRPASEITKSGKIIDVKGKNVTAYFLHGAEKAWRLCSLLGIKKAILKENSPSCGTHFVHSGKFDGTLVDGMGETAKYLKEHGILIMNEEEGLALLSKKIENKAKKQEMLEAKKAEEEKKATSKEKTTYDSRKPKADRKYPRTSKKKFGSHEKKPYGKQGPKNGKRYPKYRHEKKTDN